MVGLLVVLLLSCLVALLLGRESEGAFDTELAAIVGTALGTTFLAVGTGALAYSTVGDVRATWALLGQSRDDSLARSRPLIADVPRGVYGKRTIRWLNAQMPPSEVEDSADFAFAAPDEHTVYLSFPMRNVGAGPAQVGSSTLDCFPYGRPHALPVPEVVVGRSSLAVVPAGEVFYLEFMVGGKQSGHARTVENVVGCYSVELHYADVQDSEQHHVRVNYWTPLPNIVDVQYNPTGPAMPIPR